MSFVNKNGKRGYAHLSSKVNQIHFIPTWTPWLLDIVPAGRGFYFQHSMLIPQRWSGLPRHVPSSADDWRHVLTFQGKCGSVFGSFTTKTTRTRRRLSSQRKPWLKDGEANGPINRYSSAGFIVSLLSCIRSSKNC